MKKVELINVILKNGVNLILQTVIVRECLIPPPYTSCPFTVVSYSSPIKRNLNQEELEEMIHEYVKQTNSEKKKIYFKTENQNEPK